MAANSTTVSGSCFTVKLHVESHGSYFSFSSSLGVGVSNRYGHDARYIGSAWASDLSGSGR